MNYITKKTEIEATLNFLASFKDEPEIKTTLLPKEFVGGGEVKGFVFTQVAFTQRAYLYEVRQGGSKVWFEVIRRKTTSLLIDFEKRIYSETEFKEVYPKAHMFGLDGWTYDNLKDATIKMNLL